MLSVLTNLLLTFRKRTNTKKIDVTNSKMTLCHDTEIMMIQHTTTKVLLYTKLSSTTKITTTTSNCSKKCIKSISYELESRK